MAHDRQMLGQSGEEIAADYLQSIGFRIVERNFRTRRGEIDLIASRGRAFHFIEVKTRRHHCAGDPLEQVTPRKQRRIVAAATAYCARHRCLNAEIHFDVVSVDGALPTPAVDYLVDAFEVPEKF